MLEDMSLVRLWTVWFRHYLSLSDDDEKEVNRKIAKEISNCDLGDFSDIKHLQQSILCTCMTL